MRRIIGCLLLFILFTHLSYAQNGKVFTDADYRHAASMLSDNVNRYIDNAIQPQWLPDGRIWYRQLTENKAEYILVTPSGGPRVGALTKKELFEKAKVTQEEVKNLPDEVNSPDGKYAAF